MSAISATMVKELRDKTGAGMMDCKNALTEMKGDMEQAVDWLRKKGLAKAANKSGRIAADGLIGLAGSGKSAALVEVNAETDFVARNDQFRDMVTTVASLALKAGGDAEKTKSMPWPGGTGTVADHVAELIAKIGENMTFRRAKAVNVGNGVVSTYMHNAAAPGLGKIGVLVALESSGNAEALDQFGKQLAMHIAAANPLAVNVKDIPADAIERERSVYTEQAQASGKPADIVAKMVEGRLKKEFFQQVALMEQVFVVDGKETVGNAIKAAEKTVGGPIVVKEFVRMALGEGIAKAQTDFAAEVAAMTKK
ncbi:MAG: translation elongation factor Ts [Hyphomicrobiaceae bacterium]